MKTENGSQSALGRGIELLEWVARSTRPVSSAEAAQALGLPKPTVHRIAQQLEEVGMLQRAPNSKKFTGGPRLASIAQSALAHGVMGADRHAILQGLSEDIQETCNCTILDGHQLKYFDRVEANWPMRIHLPVGSKVPLHATAGGKMFLAMMPLQQRNTLLDTLTLTQNTAITITDRNTLEEELMKIRQLGFSTDHGEFVDGLIAVAVPVFDDQQRICFAIAVHAPSMRRTIEELKDFLPALHQAADALSTTL